VQRQQVQRQQVQRQQVQRQQVQRQQVQRQQVQRQQEWQQEWQQERQQEAGPCRARPACTAECTLARRRSHPGTASRIGAHLESEPVDAKTVAQDVVEVRGDADATKSSSYSAPC
jgi:hypothetical protein